MERSVKWPDGKPCARCKAKVTDPRAKWCHTCKVTIRKGQRQQAWVRFRKRRRERGAPKQPKIVYRGRLTAWALAHPKQAMKLALQRQRVPEALLLQS